MKKLPILTLAALSLLSTAAPVHAQGSAPSAAPITKSPAAKPPVAKEEEENLDSCQAKFQKQNIPESQYHSFMDNCTAGDSRSSASRTAVSPFKLPTLAPTLTVNPPATK